MHRVIRNRLDAQNWLRRTSALRRVLAPHLGELRTLLREAECALDRGDWSGGLPTIRVLGGARWLPGALAGLDEDIAVILAKVRKAANPDDVPPLEPDDSGANSEPDDAEAETRRRVRYLRVDKYLDALDGGPRLAPDDEAWPRGPEADDIRDALIGRD